MQRTPAPPPHVGDKFDSLLLDTDKSSTGFAHPTTSSSGTSTPQNEPSEHPEQEGGSDEAEDGETQHRKQTAYTSRVEAILCDQPEVQITIVHAGKNAEGGGSYIAYTIRIGVSTG
jgi:hypothetical protein